MSLTKQLSFATVTVEAEGKPELQDPLAGKFSRRVYVKFLAYFSTQLKYHSRC